MEYTGERVIPEYMSPKNGILREHIARYLFASKYCFGQILDLGCGVGYGTEILLDSDDENKIDHITGVDIDLDSIQYAKDMYGYLRSTFQVGDAREANFTQNLKTYDHIICYEMIEHLREDIQVIENISKMLKPQGKLFISTPFGQGKGKPCSSPYHVHQYLESEFRELLEPYFRIDMHYQRDETIERPVAGKKYYLMIAVCEHKGF
ncbi:Methyltransferase domain-containing protein [Tindallia magadiensis]|uniref:Methyltransferase domain-containing protein n=1 Tax=Tindallia magadiensis TaxID=69895 RepID=A0A1I3HIF5_9FIRM|nr:class I SAM-dependent methyltransferase [Tindallia magadiensis]SFI35506.1 Methyltransferase domain-containing protein [Tindallia magadiensis]